MNEALSFRAWLAWSIEQALYNRDALDPKAAQIMTAVLEQFDARAALSKSTQPLEKEGGR